MGAIAVVAGAYLGAGGAVAGAFSWGAFGLGLLPLAFNEFGGAQGQRIDTPAVARSEYGVPLPRGWGRHYTVGNTVWSIPHNRRDQQHGSFGSPKVIETTFYGNWLTLHGVGARPGKTMRLNRMWALQGETQVLLHNWNDGITQEGYFVEYDEDTGVGVGYWGGDAAAGTIRIYTGTDNQPVLPEIEAANGVGQTQAWVNRRGILMLNFPLQEFGNNHPPIRCEWIESTTSVGDLAGQIAACVENDDSSFSAATDCDYSALDADTFDGFIIDQRREAENEFEQIRRVFACHFADLNGKITAVKLGGDPVATLVAADDLGYRDLGAEPVPIVDRDIQNKSTLPDQIDFAFLDKDRDGKVNTQPGQRLTVQTGNKTELTTQFLMRSNQARNVIETILAQSWTMREPLGLAASWRRLWLAPGDVVTVVRDGVGEDVLLSNVLIRLWGPLDLQAQLYNKFIYTQEWIGQTAPLDASTGPPTAAPLYVKFESVALDPSHTEHPGFYIVASQPYDTSWVDYRFMETSLIATLMGALQANSVPRLSRGTIGTAVDVLPDWSGGSSFLQEGVTVRVDLDYGALVSVDEADMVAGANTLVWGSEANGWEALAFTEAEAISGAAAGKQRYSISGSLWRGKRGSEAFIGTHAVGDKVVLINEAVERINISPEYLNVPKEYAIRYSTSIETKSSLATMSHTTVGTSMEPLSVVDIETESVRDTGTNDVTIAWLKRSRLSESYWLTGQDPTNAPYDLDQFEIDIMDGATVVDTITGITGTSYEYSAAAQTAAGLTPGDPLTVRVYQMSSMVGRGFVAEATIA